MEDLYPGTYSIDSGHAEYAPTGFAETIMSRMDRIDEELRRVRKKKKQGKKKTIKNKKLKRRLRAMEAEHEQLKYFLQGFVMQQYAAKSKPWWQNAVVNGLPKLIEMGGVVLNNVTQKPSQLLLGNGKQNPLYLSDSNDK